LSGKPTGNQTADARAYQDGRQHNGERKDRLSQKKDKPLKDRDFYQHKAHTQDREIVSPAKSQPGS
jgi:hypothetical protein